MAGGAEAIGSVIGGILGNNAAKMDRSKAKEKAKEALQYWKDLGMAPDTSLPLMLKELQAAGQLTPELEEEMTLAASEFNNIQEDQGLRDTQLEALNKFKQNAETGFGPEERAAYNQMQQGVRQDTRAKQEQILADQQRRGMGGSGNELIAQLQASQSGADQQADGANDLMAMLAERMRQGSQDMASTAANVRGQDYTVASDKAKALDARNQFLNQNATARERANVLAKNNAQAANLANAQNISNQNVANANAELARQQAAKVTQYGQNLQKTAGISGASNNMSDFYANQGNAKAAAQVAIGQGAGQAVDAGAEMAMKVAPMAASMSDERNKEDIEYNDQDMESFLDSITPVSFNYKPEVRNDPRASKDRQLGVMAQDLEKTPMGDEAVNETDKGKIVNYDDLQPKMLAALAYLNNKLKKYEGK